MIQIEMRNIYIICFLLLLIIGIIPVLGDIEDNPLAMKRISSTEDLEKYFSRPTNTTNPEGQIKKTTLANGGALSETRDIRAASTELPEGIRTYQKSFAYSGEFHLPNEAPENQVYSFDSKSEPSSYQAGAEGASTYTTTNVQVRGVDEPDFIKNDGKYIYIISKKTLTIIDGYPAENARILSQTPIEGDVSDIFLNGDRTVIFTGKNGQGWIKPSGSVTPVPKSEYQTHALVYSVFDRAHPSLLRDISIPGTYQNARMIDSDIYVLNKESRSSGDYHMPALFDGGKEISIRNIWAPPTPPDDYNFYSLSSFNILNDAQPSGESFLLGRDSTLYVSPGNVYIAYKNLPGTIQGSSQQQSVIHRFAIKDGKISYKATGIFPGYLLNQFSLDELDGNLRVATTKDEIGGSTGRSNGVYVLDPDLTVIGKLDHLAPGEKIYSARFMDDILYLVTFRSMDPLFVIDLSNPKNPGILGELKIPGYSDYLHPYDKTHLIGIGKDTNENQWGVSPTVIKIALFDVSNLTNPTEIDHIVIGTKGSDSEALHDHRAFLFDRTKNVMAIPIKEITNAPTPGSQYNGSYIPSSWQGTYVYGIDPAKGFIAKGRVTQNKIGTDNFYDTGSVVKRSLLMDTILYTVSTKNIIATDINDFSRSLADISL